MLIQVSSTSMIESITLVLVSCTSIVETKMLVFALKMLVQVKKILVHVSSTSILKTIILVLVSCTSIIESIRHVVFRDFLHFIKNSMNLETYLFPLKALENEIYGKFKWMLS